MKKWWNKNRKHRIEKGTSQDFCPRNGDVVTFALIMTIISLLLFIVGM